MTTLSCSVNTCAYNADECCSKGDIVVGGKLAGCCNETKCDSYKAKTMEGFTSSCTCHASSVVNVDCEATKCCYNKDYECHAGKVKIGGGAASCSDQTMCDTFMSGK